MSGRNVAVLTIHGINTNAKGFSDKLKRGVRRKLARPARQQMIWGEAFWADITRDRQNGYIDRIAESDLTHKSARKWVINGLGDAAAYQKAKVEGNHAYQRIQDKLRDTLVNDLAPPEGELRPLLIVAHSLGGHVASTFIHDTLKAARDNPARTPREAFLNLQTLAGIVTFGCNIPLFTFAFKAPDVLPIKFPEPALLKGAREWRNLFSPTDVLGFPLRPLNDGYWETVLTDKVVHTGLFLGQTPLSHNHYWANGRVQKDVSELVTQLLEADLTDAGQSLLSGTVTAPSSPVSQPVSAPA